MRTVEDIQKDIKQLPHEEYMRLAHWFSEQDWKSWDDEIERDSRSGKLDFLFDEAMNEKNLENSEICNAQNNIKVLALLIFAPK